MVFLHEEEEEGAEIEEIPSADNRNYYEILNLPINASYKEIRESYFRLKNTYGNGNQALYSLMDEDEMSDSLSEINEAYETLIREENRINYDKSLIESGVGQIADYFIDIQHFLTQGNQQNINCSFQKYRKPEDQFEEEVDLVEQTISNECLQAQQAEELDETSPLQSNDFVIRNSTSKKFTSSAFVGAATSRRLVTAKASGDEMKEKISQLIKDGDLGSGELYRNIRELVGISMKEMQDQIKVSMSYLENLEKNNFDLLPQPVYVKGFLKSYFRFLGLTSYENLVNAYAERQNNWIKEKSI